MNKLRRGRNGTLILLLGILLLPGCAYRMPSWVPFQETPDRLPGVPTPAEKLRALRKLAKEAEAQNAEEKLQVVDELVKSLPQEKDPMIRGQIITTLACYPGTTSDEVLRVAVRDEDPDVRIAVCKAWARRGGPESTRVLSGVLGSDTELDVRIAAAKALGQSKDPGATAVLGNVLEDPNPALQQEAVLALRNVSGKDFGDDLNQWRQFAKGETPKPSQPVSVAERIRRAL